MDKRGLFAELFRAEYPGIVRELRLILGDVSLAEEVVADAFVDLWRKWDSISGYDRPGAWVRHVAVRKAGRARWRRGRRVAIEESFTTTSPSPGIDEDLAHALGQLPLAQRTAVVMHHLGGWSTGDIADVLGCADVTVRSHLSRGRKRLGELLESPNRMLEVNDVEPG